MVLSSFIALPTWTSRAVFKLTLGTPLPPLALHVRIRPPGYEPSIIHFDILAAA